MANVSANGGAARSDGEGRSARASPRLIFYWIATALAAVAFVMPGLGNLSKAPNIAHDMAHLGYPQYFLTILGTWKVLGAIVIVSPRLPRLKEWAYAGMIFDLTGAATSRAVMRDGAAMVIIPLLIAVVVSTSWVLRPRGRKLESRSPPDPQWLPRTSPAG
jgi:uncharacterized membrane protein YphA (DoxX/SURF4 family)